MDCTLTSTEVVQRAKEFAVAAHSSINHHRKYTHEPYSVHLQNVADLVASVTDHPAAIAAAWLHDVVEDTATTLEQVEAVFGQAIARMVDCLTDVSKTSDGNRATRKEIDRLHLARATPDAKTIKLADLIDNCRDICKHNKRFARVYLKEMNALLQVLADGDPKLYGLACRAHLEGSQGISDESGVDDRPEDSQAPLEQQFPNLHLIDLFTRSFTVKILAEPLHSIDINSTVEESLVIMSARSLSVVGLRENGELCGYVREADMRLASGNCADHLRLFRQGQIISDDSSFTELIQVLTRQEYAFVRVFGPVGGYVDRGRLNSPVTRMWLFGILTIFEMRMAQLIQNYYPDESWRPLIPSTRLEKAVNLQEERSRRNQQTTLLECLQFSDKGHILLEHPLGRKLLDIKSKASAKRMIKSVESLRNNLAHGQDIVRYDWSSIAAIAARIEEASYLIKFKVLPWEDG